MNMKKKLSLVRLTRNEIEEVRGGYIVIGDNKKVCGCGCYGPSSSADNKSANYDNGLFSPIQ